MNRFSDKTIAAVAVLLAILFGGAQAVFVKIALKQASPEFFTFFRFLAASIILLPFFLSTKIKFDKNFLKLLTVTLFSTANILLFAYGVRLTTASIGNAIYVFVPLLVALLSYLILKENIRSKKLAGVFIGFLGAVIIIFLPVIEKGSLFSGNLIGNLLILIGAISYSLFNVLSKKIQAKFSPIQITMVFSLSTVLITFILGFKDVINATKEISSFSPITIFSTLYVGIFGTALFYLLQQYAIKHGSPTISSMVLYLQTATTIIFASIILGERITLGFVVGAILAVIGTTAVIKSK